MKREEAIENGYEVHDIQHTMKRRSLWHDYSLKGTYMLTLVVTDRMPLLGILRGTTEEGQNLRDAGKGGCLDHGEMYRIVGEGHGAFVELSPLGKAIMEEEIKKIHHFYPQVEVWKLCIMPDHLHMIVRVKENMGKGKHLGQVVRGFKTGCSRALWRLLDEMKAAGDAAGTGAGFGAGCSRAWWRLLDEMKAAGDAADTVAGLGAGDAAGTVAGLGAGDAGGTVAGLGASVSVHAASPAVSQGDLPSVSSDRKRPLLFESGYNDKILLHEGQLDNWKRYLDDNPRRLLMKRLNPQLFNVIAGMMVVGNKCQVVGNRFLLDIPDKVAVIVHRRNSDDEYARLCKEWLACGERGGVLVSAAISPKEKVVMREAMNRGFRIILLRENGFPELYKPSGESFDACAKGLLLQVSPWEYHMEKKVITREQCLFLNAIAEKIVYGEVAS